MSKITRTITTWKMTYGIRHNGSMVEEKAVTIPDNKNTTVKRILKDKKQLFITSKNISNESDVEFTCLMLVPYEQKYEMSVEDFIKYSKKVEG